MIVVPPIQQSLTAAEIASLVVFAVQADIAIEIGANEDSSLYAAIDGAAGFGKAIRSAAWVISREAGLIVAYSEQQEVARSFSTVGDALASLADVLRTPVQRFG